ncbi:MAG: WD40 repeat domain-containing protein [Desulfobacteria bacterium]
MIKRLPLIILISAAILLSSNITFTSEKLAPATVSRGPRFLVQLGHSSTVTSIAISPDGKYALSGSNGKTLKL